MRKSYLFLTGVIAALLSSAPAKAQYLFSSVNTYRQNFDSLGTVDIPKFINNKTLKGLYAEARIITGINSTTKEPIYSTVSPDNLQANDGKNEAGNYYHFGLVGVAERSFGGIAATVTQGIGYAGYRFKNTTANTTFINLEVAYVMEQWYNSGRVDAARVDFSYQKSNTAITSLQNGTWTGVDALSVAAPSTAGIVESKNGNADTNRRQLSATITGLNLKPGEEVMLRWRYTLNSQTNGNGLSIDDLVVTPQSNIYYSKTTGNLDATSSWTPNANGTGNSPANFATPNTVYYVRGNATASRINKDWVVSGNGSKIIVGVPGEATPSTLIIESKDNVTGTIDVSAGATLTISRLSTDPTNFTLGRLDNASTVEYKANNGLIQVKEASYGNLKLTDKGTKTLLTGTVLNGNLVLSNSTIQLNDNNLTILKGGGISGNSSTAYVVTNGKGALRRTVGNTGTDVIFPVGSSATSYTPAYLQQPNTTARNEDVYAVRVIDNMYSRYDAAENGVGPVIANQNVKKTWLVSEESAGNSNITMGLQWEKSDEINGAASVTFTPSKAYVAHYLTSPQPYFDRGPVAVATTVGSEGFRVNRSGITSFSPFSVSSRTVAPLPVQLVAFTASAAGSTVRCAWQTASELNNARFVVERSTNGQSFTAIGSVAGRGTTSTGQQYHFTDAAPAIGVNYYRLRQVDTDKQESLSGVAVVNMGKGAVAQVTPNPGTQTFRVLLPMEAVVVEAKVFNILGAQVATVSTDGSFTLDRQPTGVYIVRVSTTEGTQSIRVIKE